MTNDGSPDHRAFRVAGGMAHVAAAAVEERHDRMLLRIAQLAASIDAAHRRVPAWTWEDDTSPRERHRCLALARALVASMSEPTSYMLARAGVDRDTAAAVWRAMVGAMLEETPDVWRPR